MNVSKIFEKTVDVAGSTLFRCLNFGYRGCLYPLWRIFEFDEVVYKKLVRDLSDEIFEVEVAFFGDILQKGKKKIELKKNDTGQQKIKVRYLFNVPGDKVEVGCCARYSLKEAMFYHDKVGGDPACGGGIKHHWAPAVIEKKMRKKLKSLMRKKQVGVKFYECQGDSSVGETVFLLGQKNVVDCYVQWRRLDVRKVEVLAFS